MAEYIKRDTAIRAVMAAKWVDGSDGAMAMEIVASPPAAEVVSVVRCKDCKYAYINSFSAASGIVFCSSNMKAMQQDDFCSYGERMDGGAENEI